MDERLKQRLVGAAVLTSLAVIFIPMLFDTRPPPEQEIVSSNIPEKPDGGFSSRIVPLEEGAPMEEAEAAAQTRAPAPEPAPGSGSRAGAAPQPPPAPPPDASGGAAPGGSERVGLTAWAVQLGSFSNEQNAVALIDRLRDKGYTAFVEPAKGGKDTLTRVYVGPELERDAAEQIRGKLEKEFKLKGLVVRYPGG